MQVRAFPDADAASEATARWVSAWIAENPSGRLGLPTGRTPDALYRHLIQARQEQGLRLHDLQVFGLDEYVGLGPDHPASFGHTLRRSILEPGGIARARLWNGTAPDPEKECRDFDQDLREAGGLDLLVLGIGTNGHVAFNEPECDPAARAHVVELAPSTRDANAAAFGGRWEQVPTQAMTLGIAALMEAHCVVLMALGASKHAALQRALHQPPDAACPASWLQNHPQVTVWADAQALGTAT